MTLTTKKAPLPNTEVSDCCWRNVFSLLFSQKDKMEQEINYTGNEIALALNRQETKGLSVLVDFWSEYCKGCKKMNEPTYRDNQILQYLKNNFVFVKYNTKKSIWTYKTIVCKL